MKIVKIALSDKISYLFFIIFLHVEEIIKQSNTLNIPLLNDGEIAIESNHG